MRVDKKYIRYLIPLLLTALLSISFAFFNSTLELPLLLLALLLSCFYAFWGLKKYYENVRKLSTFSGIDGVFVEALRNAPTPFCVMDEAAKCVWANRAFTDRFPVKNLAELYPTVASTQINCRPNSPTTDMTELTYQDKTYIVHTFWAKDNQRNLCLQYYVDNSKLVALQQRYTDVLPVVCLVHIDNYEEVVESKDAQSLSEADTRITSYILSLGGIVRRHEPGKYIAILPHAGFVDAQTKKFALLDTVRDIATPSSVPLTLSIAIGVNEELKEAYRSAQQALELAIGRGGDQAVIKEGSGHLFYGGKRQSAERYSKVKSRVVSRSLSNLMLQYDQVLVMGHRVADMDCIGAAIGVVRFARALHKPVHIVIDKPSVMIHSFMEDPKTLALCDGLFIRAFEAVELCNERTMVIVVDTQRKQATPAPNLLDDAGAVVIFDHHRRSTDVISDATLQYTQTYASSTCELITEIAQYFVPEAELTPFECTILLAGITLDTKNFSYNTGVRTFEAAAYLRRGGADVAYIKQMYQDDMSTFVDRSKIVKSAERLMPNIAIAVCPEDAQNSELLVAQAADALTTIKGIQASFVLAKSANAVLVSARSFGDINVQVILEKIGGGGHINMAGAKLENTNLDGAKELVKYAVEKYFEEEKK